MLVVQMVELTFDNSIDFSNHFPLDNDSLQLIKLGANCTGYAFAGILRTAVHKTSNATE